MASPAQHNGSQNALLVCGECGERNGESESFCTQCGAYLAWDGQRIRPDPREALPEPEQQPVPAAPPGFVQRVKRAVGIDDDTREAGHLRPASPPSSGHAPPQEVEPTQTTADVPLGQPVVALPPKPAAPPSGATELPAVKPGERATKAAPRPQRPVTAGPQPGDVICGQCGASNRPERKYCRLCAASLAEAPVVGRKRWWQRRGTESRSAGTKTGPTAGSRPRVRRAWRFHTRWLAVLLLLAAAAGGAYLGRDALLGAFNYVQDRLAANEPVHPSSVTASSFLPGREPDLAADGTVDRSWAPARPGDGVGQSWTAVFSAPYRLVYLQIRGGAAEQDELFLAEGRPSSMRVTITAGTGKVTTQDITLADKAGNQQFHIGADDVQEVTLTVQSSKGSGPDRHVALAEVEFRGRR